MSYYNADDYNDRYFRSVLKTNSCGRPNYSESARGYDAYYHRPAGIKTIQFIPESSDCTYSNDNRTNSSLFVINSGNPPRRVCDPAYLRFKTDGEW